MLLFNFKILLLLFDQFCGSLLLYVFLVSLAEKLFASNTDTALMLSVIILLPFTGMISNTVVNFPLLFVFYRSKAKATNMKEVWQKAIVRTFSPLSMLFTFLTVYNMSITIYILNKVALINLNASLASIGEALTWDPRRLVLWFVSVNLIINYGAGILATIVFLSVMMLKTGLAVFRIRD